MDKSSSTTDFIGHHSAAATLTRPFRLSKRRNLLPGQAPPGSQADFLRQSRRLQLNLEQILPLSRSFFSGAKGARAVLKPDCGPRLRVRQPRLSRAIKSFRIERASSEMRKNLRRTFTILSSPSFLLYCSASRALGGNSPGAPVVQGRSRCIKFTQVRRRQEGWEGLESFADVFADKVFFFRPFSVPPLPILTFPSRSLGLAKEGRWSVCLAGSFVGGNRGEVASLNDGNVERGDDRRQRD